MNEQLIPYIINESGEISVSAKALHEFLQIKTSFKVCVINYYNYKILLESIWRIVKKYMIIKIIILINYVIVYNNEGNMNVEGVLTLQGSQGMGKTRFIKEIIPLYVKTGLDLDPRDKDKINQCIKYWVYELGELDSTLKKDLQN